MTERRTHMLSAGLGQGERVNPSLIQHRQTEATAIYVADKNRYIPRPVFDRWQAIKGKIK